MIIYAIIENDVVINIIEYETAPTTPPPGFPDGITSMVANGAGPGWTVVNGVLTAPPAAPAPPLTLSQQAQVAMGAGLAVTSTSTPALSATYPVDTVSMATIQSEAMSVLLNNTFSDGTTTLAWPDVSGVTHTFPSTAMFNLFATACSAYVAALGKVINGTSSVLPSNAVTIS